jgi:hypothetical protein
MSAIRYCIMPLAPLDQGSVHAVILKIIAELVMYRYMFLLQACCNEYKIIVACSTAMWAVPVQSLILLNEMSICLQVDEDKIVRYKRSCLG